MLSQHRRRVAGAIIITLCTAWVALAQQAATATTAKDDSFVAEKGFRSKIFDVKNRDPHSLVSVLSPLGSGFRGATIAPNRDFGTLTVRDFPENLAVIEEALKRLDVPQAGDPGIELRLHVLIASNLDGAVNPHPEELNSVLKELQSTLNYKNYYLVNSQIHRVKSNTDFSAAAVAGSGSSEISQPLVAQMGTADFSYSYTINSVAIQPNSSGPSTVQLNQFNFNTGQDVPGRPTVRTSVSLRDGEKVVVGTASFKDKGLILVLSAKVIR